MDSTIGTALSGLLGTVVALAVVLGLAWVVLRALRQWQDRKAVGEGAQDHRLRFVRALAVGQRERVMLIEAQDELMLIGVSQGSVRLLRSWPGAAEPQMPDMVSPDRPPAEGAR